MSRIAIYIIVAYAALSCATTRSARESGSYFDSVAADSAPRDPSMSATDYYMRGVYISRQRDDDSLAKIFLMRALEADSMHSAAMFELASISDSREDSTLKYIERAVAIDSTNSWYRYLLSRIYADKGHMNNAIYEAEKMIELGERGSETYQYMARLYQMKERPIMAAAVLDSAMVLYGYQPELVLQKNDILTALGFTDKKIEFLSKVIADGNQYQRYNIALGDAYLQKGQDSLALDQYDKAREISSEDPVVPYAFMEYYRANNRVTDFLLELINIVKNDYVNVAAKISLVEPYLDNELVYRENHMLMDNLMTIFYYKFLDNYDVSKLYARHNINMGKLDETLKVYQRYAKEAESKDAFQNVIGIYTYREQFDSAMIYYKKAMELLPGDNDITMMGVTIAYGSKDFESAIKITKSTIKDIKSDSLKSIQYGIVGDLYHEIDDVKSCYKYYNKALALDSTNIAVLNNYSYFLSLEERDLDRALEMIENVINSGSSTSTHLDTYAWILHKLGRNEEARKVMQRAVALNSSGEATLYDHYAYILLALGNETMARFYWNKALENGLTQEEYDSRIASLESRHHIIKQN